jgi:serine/threonine protein kinase
MIGEELALYEYEILSDDGSLALFRGRSRDRQTSILLRSPSSSSFTTTDHERLSREHSLANRFDESWAARPRALGEWRGRPALLINDPGGLPLSSLRKQSLNLRRFLKIAIAFANALRRLHEKELIHRDLRPANLLVGEDSDWVWRRDDIAARESGHGSGGGWRRRQFEIYGARANRSDEPVG